MRYRVLSLFILLGASLIAADTYSGPKPPKPDVPYLVHADNLVETEAAEAREENRKGEVTYTIPGATSRARTPLAEPIFIIQTKQLAADRIELYKLDVKNGQREITMTQKRKKSGARQIHVQVTRLGDQLYRIEADEQLENGEYSLSPNDSNRVFCFEVY
jgi:hypothetical protein